MQRRNLLSNALIISSQLLLYGCVTAGHGAKANTNDSSHSAVVLIESTDTKLKSPDKYFSREHERIALRRKHFGFDSGDGEHRPPVMLGLALSGGGIRSKAYQLGVLAGLHAEAFGTHTLLDRVDYMSSVSGGSWAAGSVWAWPGDVTAMFACLDSVAEKGAKQAVNDDPACADAAKMMRTHQDVEHFSSPGEQRKEVWRKDIQLAHLPRGCDVQFDRPIAEPCTDNLVVKPYPIFNSTHSAPSESPGADGFPFESTPDGAGTIVDSGSKRPDGKDRKGDVGFFVNFHQTEMRWVQRDFFRARIPGGDDGLEDGTGLSLVMAHSSGLVKGPVVPAAFLSYYFNLEQGNERYRNARLRTKYKLTDGGKSENSGILSLVERGADIIIASYMGKEKVATPFGDLDIARQQASQLFGCTLAAIDEKPTHPRIQVSSYSCPTVPNSTNSALVHVHPWASNIDDFIAYVAAEGQSGRPGMATVANYLAGEATKIKNAEDRFPQTRTLQTDYDEPLVRAYYLLGKFSVRKDVAPYLRATLAK